jgi:hypothetical protein
MRYPLRFCLLAALSLWCWWQIRVLGDVRLHLAAFYGCFAAAFGLYLAALWLVRRTQRRRRSARSAPAALGVILITAAAARAMLLPATPTLSDDIYRYMWDGRVQEAGIDPYSLSPDDPELAFLRNEAWTRVNFPHLRTIYPPLTELSFRAGEWFGGTPAAHKLIFLLAELLTLLSLALLLRRRKISPLWLAAYAWHPLVILEIAGQGHNDALGASLLWAGVAAWESRWPAMAALSWAASFLSKFLSVILVPWWWLRKRDYRWLLAFLALASLPFAFHRPLTEALLGSLSAMTARGGANPSLYLLVAGAAEPHRAAPLFALALWGAFLLWWARRESDPVRYIVGGLAAAALLAPALHPWYLVWLIPGFVFWRPAALIALTATAVLAYAVWPGYLASGQWSLPAWAHALQYAPVALLGMWGVMRWWWGSSFRPATKPQLSVRSSRSCPAD